MTLNYVEHFVLTLANRLACKTDSLHKAKGFKQPKKHIETYHCFVEIGLMYR